MPAIAPNPQAATAAFAISPCTSTPTRRPLTCAAAGPSSQLPLRVSSQTAQLSHAAILTHAAESVAAIASTASADPHLRLTVDFPAERSESRAGTLVSRFENNLNFLERLTAELGAQNPKPVGGNVDICDNINPQGGGEYLTDDEVIVGVHAESSALGRPLVALMNAGVDAATLAGVRDLDNDADAVVLLVNCGLGRLSWFSKLSVGKYFDDYRPAYYLKNIAGNGWLLKRGLEPWRVFAQLSTGIDLVWECEERPSIVDAEAEVRLALAGIKRDK